MAGFTRGGKRRRQPASQTTTSQPDSRRAFDRETQKKPESGRSATAVAVANQPATTSSTTALASGRLNSTRRRSSILNRTKEQRLHQRFGQQRKQQRDNIGPAAVWTIPLLLTAFALCSKQLSVAAAVENELASGRARGQAGT